MRSSPQVAVVPTMGSASASDALRVHRVCTSTGLALVGTTPQQTIWRIAKTSYGPLNPPHRAGTGSRLDWGRYDVPGHRTVYGAAPPQAAYAESIAFARPAFDAGTVLMRDLFDDVDPLDNTPLFEVIDRQWADRDHQPPGLLAAGWRQERLIYELRLPETGWFVDIEAAVSVAAVAGGLGKELARLGLRTLTVADLRGPDRTVTTTIAKWVRAQTLDDGSLPHGVQFGSKHGSDWHCWAVWLRAVDDGKTLSEEPTQSDDGHEIQRRELNPPLAEVADLFQIRTQ